MTNAKTTLNKNNKIEIEIFIGPSMSGKSHKAYNEMKKVGHDNSLSLKYMHYHKIYGERGSAKKMFSYCKLTTKLIVVDDIWHCHDLNRLLSHFENGVLVYKKHNTNKIPIQIKPRIIFCITTDGEVSAEIMELKVASLLKDNAAGKFSFKLNFFASIVPHEVQIKS